MKIALVSEYFYPYSVGGTEKYVFQQARELLNAKHEVIIISIKKDHLSSYIYEGIKIFCIDPNTFMDSFAANNAPNLNQFLDLIIQENIEELYFHTFTTSIHYGHLKAAHKYVKSIFAFAHIPDITCLHGDLMLFGEKKCDGLIVENRCLSCYYSKKYSKLVSKTLINLNLKSGDPLNLRPIINSKKNNLAILNEYCKGIYIFTEWQKAVFQLNGFEKNKLIKKTQQNLIPPFQIKPEKKDPAIFKIGFVGRITPEKGLDQLIAGVNKIDTSKIQLKIAGVIDPTNVKYHEQLLNKTKKMSNVTWNYSLGQNELDKFYEELDLICIPSLWNETGPYVLFESLNKQIPVLANDLGDMSYWQAQGYPVSTYSNENQLLDQLKRYIERYK